MTINEFLQQGVTPYQVADNVVSVLTQNGFTEASGKLVRGGKYIVRKGCAVFGIAIGEGSDFHVAACHTDTPCFKFKQQPDKRVGEATVWLTEPYGGAIRHTWTDRPLGIAGVVAVREAQGARVCPVVLSGRYTIPSVAIHFNRTVNENCALNAATDFNVLGTGSLRSVVADALGVDEADILCTDLRTFCPDEPYESGLDFVSPRIDNLTSAYSILTALCESNPSAITVGAFFDLEEVGSRGEGGADSPILADLLAQIARDLCLDGTQKVYAMSVDNAHGEHPLHPELTANTDTARLGGGIVVKYNANLRYSTTVRSGALARLVCEKAGVASQVFSQRSDLPCGSTLGVINVGHLDCVSADIGIAQLAMHAASEVCRKSDIDAMTAFLTAFFSARIAATDTTVTVE